MPEGGVPTGADSCDVARLLPREDVTWYIYGSVTHAHSDGASGLPFYADLLRLYQQEIGEAAPQPETALQEQLELLQGRLWTSLRGRLPGEWSPNDDVYHDALFADWGRRAGMQRRFRFEEPVMRALSLAATHVLACGLDVAWLVAIVGAIFRLFPAQPRLSLMLMCPCRDGAGEAGLVGFIGERRVIPVDVGETTLANLVDVAEAISTARKRRTWHTPEPFEAGLCIYVNIVSAMTHGLQDGCRQVMPPPTYHPGQWQCTARHPVNIRLDQLKDLDWDFKLSQYDARWGWGWSTHFAQALGCTISDMACNPYAPLVPAEDKWGPQD